MHQYFPAQCKIFFSLRKKYFFKSDLRVRTCIMFCNCNSVSTGFENPGHAGYIAKHHSKEGGDITEKENVKEIIGQNEKDTDF